MIQSDPAGRFVFASRPGPRLDLQLEVRRPAGAGSWRTTHRSSPCRRATGRGISPSIPAAAGSIRCRRKPRRSPSSAYDAQRGRLTPRQTISSLPEGFAGTDFTSEIVVTPDGRFVYAANRLHDSIAWFSIDATGSSRCWASSGRGAITRGVSASIPAAISSSPATSGATPSPPSAATSPAAG